VSPRGIGSLVSVVVVGVLIKLLDGRILLALARSSELLAFLLGQINLGISMTSVVVPNLITIAGGFIFVPLTP